METNIDNIHNLENKVAEQNKRINKLEDLISNLTRDNAEMTLRLNLLLTTNFEISGESLKRIEEQNKLASALLKEFKVKDFRNDIKDL